MLQDFVRDQWAGRLIQGWTDGWLDWPLVVGDRLGAAVLGAAPGQVVVADSTTVLLYKLARAAVDARPGRHQVVLDTDNFPTDRYVLEGIAAERGLELVWIATDPTLGVTPSSRSLRSSGRDGTGAVQPRRLPLGLHRRLRRHHRDRPRRRSARYVGPQPLGRLGAAGPRRVGRRPRGGLHVQVPQRRSGRPAFAYVRAGLPVQQPIWGWMGRRDPFEMGPGYTAVEGVRSMLSGTPPILAMVPLLASLDLIEEVGITAIRAKSVALTSYALTLVDEWLVPLGVSVDSPRDPTQRGGHVTVRRTGFRSLLEPLWAAGVVPDYRAPDALRLGLSPLSTSFAEVHDGVRLIADSGGFAVTRLRPYGE